MFIHLLHLSIEVVRVSTLSFCANFVLVLLKIHQFLRQLLNTLFEFEFVKLSVLELSSEEFKVTSDLAPLLFGLHVLIVAFTGLLVFQCAHLSV